MVEFISKMWVAHTEALVWVFAYGLCPLLGGFIIWMKQGRYLTEDQPIAFLMFGPLMPLISLLPKRFFTSREQQEGLDG